MLRLLFVLFVLTSFCANSVAQRDLHYLLSRYFTTLPGQDTLVLKNMAHELIEVSGIDSVVYQGIPVTISKPEIEYDYYSLQNAGISKRYADSIVLRHSGKQATIDSLESLIILENEFGLLKLSELARVFITTDTVHSALFSEEIGKQYMPFQNDYIVLIVYVQKYKRKRIKKQVEKILDSYHITFTEAPWD